MHDQSLLADGVRAVGEAVIKEEACGLFADQLNIHGIVQDALKEHVLERAIKPPQPGRVGMQH